MDEWSALASWDAQLQLRDEGALVTPLSLESDGRLRVRRQGRQETVEGARG